MPAPARAKRPGAKPDDLPLEERIPRRAHELYLDRAGSEIEDWLQAEDEIRNMEEQKRNRRRVAGGGDADNKK
jgi:CRISPR/Cas system endoribonuclease Cas6 (RAMP superfamily)